MLRKPRVQGALFPGFFPPAVAALIPTLSAEAFALAKRLHSITLEGEGAPTWLEALVASVEETPGARLADVLEDDLRELSAAARHRAWWTIRTGCKATLAKIGQAFARGKSDIHYGIGRHEERRRSNAAPLFPRSSARATNAPASSPIAEQGACPPAQLSFPGVAA